MFKPRNKAEVEDPARYFSGQLAEETAWLWVCDPCQDLRTESVPQRCHNGPSEPAGGFHITQVRPGRTGAREGI
jgi:hypothetical protein